jgi:hypothetical protein
VYVFEDPCVGFAPNLLSDKEGEGGNGFAVSHMDTRHVLPPKLDEKAAPLIWLNVGDVQSLLNVSPKVNGVPTLGEEQANRFRGLVAKGAKVPKPSKPLCTRRRRWSQ